MGGKAKPTKHSAKEIAGKVAAATTNKGGGKAGLADRKGGAAGHAKFKCPSCGQQVRPRRVASNRSAVASVASGDLARRHVVVSPRLPLVNPDDFRLRPPSVAFEIVKNQSQAPSIKSAEMHWDSKHSKLPFVPGDWSDTHAEHGGVTTAGVAVKGAAKQKTVHELAKTKTGQEKLKQLEQEKLKQQF
jgi:hypothetical protein